MKNIVTVLVAFLLPSLAAAATLSLSPSSQRVSAGEVFTVQIILDTQDTYIDGVDLRYLNYNPNMLEVQDANLGLAGVQISSGSLLPVTLANIADANLGRISFSQVVAAGRDKYEGSGVLATVAFKALSPGAADVTLDYASGKTTDSNVASAGVDVLNSVVNGSYTISGSPKTTGYGAFGPMTGARVNSLHAVSGAFQNQAQLITVQLQAQIEALLAQAQELLRKLQAIQ